jgi:hypothetical protein
MPALPEEVYPAAPPTEWEQLVRLLPVDLEATARATGALRRRRRVTSAATLLRLALAYALEGRSLRATGAWALLAGTANLSAEALGKRLRRSRAGLGTLVAALVRAGSAALPTGAARVRVLDASLVQRPGRSGRDLRLHLSLDLGREQVDGLRLTDARVGETLLRCDAGPGEILLADAGYSHRRGLAALLTQGADAVVRYAWQSLPLRTPTGAPLPPAALAARLAMLPPATTADWPVEAGPPAGPPLPLRLVAGRLPPVAAAPSSGPACAARPRRRGGRCPATAWRWRTGCWW